MSASRRALAADALSVANGACGLLGVLALLADRSAQGLTIAALLVFIAWAFDSLDGTVARGLTRPPAEGAVLDSLSDAVSFGVLPAALVSAAWTAAGTTPAVGGVIGVIFFACAILRLRRYTVRAVSADRHGVRLCFEGMPSPAATMTVAAVVLASRASSGVATAWAGVVAAAVTAPLMVSTLPYPDLLRIVFISVRARWIIPAAVAWFALGGAAAAAIFFVAYVVIGPAAARRVQRRAAVQPAERLEHSA